MSTRTPADTFVAYMVAIIVTNTQVYRPIWNIILMRYVRSRLRCEFLSIDTNARNCRCLCGLRIITKAYSQASSARRSSVSIAQPPLGMTPWSFEYWRLALDFGENVHIWRNMCKYGGICAKNSKIVQTRCKTGGMGRNNLICFI